MDGDGHGRTRSRSRHGRQSNSLLEQLPTELLQDVFLFSANLSLPLCSKQLLSALTSEHLKFEITLQILVYQTQKLDEEDKARLLSRRFFTWDFIVRYIAFAHSRVAIAAPHENEEDDEFDDEDEGYAATERSTSRPPSRQAKSETTPTCIEIDTDFTALTRNAIADLRRDELGHLTEVDPPPAANLRRLTGTKSLEGLRDLDLPAKFLHHGWDDDQLRLLRLLIAFGCTVSRTSPAGLAADEGILEAVAQGDEEVVSHFLGLHVGVEPEVEMLREAMKGTNLSIVYQLLRSAHGHLDSLDPQVWRLLDEHMAWRKAQKDTVRRWLQNGVEGPVHEEDTEYLPHLRNIEVDTSRWNSFDGA